MDVYCGNGCGRKSYMDPVFDINYPASGIGRIYDSFGATGYIEMEKNTNFRDPMFR